MSFVWQRTLRSTSRCSGVGLHSGSDAVMVLHPAQPGTGVRFLRTDVAGRPVEIQATWQNAIERPLCTTLANREGVTVATVEHLMSALFGCGIDNVLVELHGSEVPAMDGSAAPFVAMIERAGIEEQMAPRRVLEILKPISVCEPHRRAALMPAEGFSLDFEIEFDNPVVGRQHWSLSMDNGTYKHEVARARTFGFLHEVDMLRTMGLALGGSLDNAVVIDGDRILNEGGLHFENEFVRHKVLDAIGDLYLLGGPLLGHFRGVRAGHTLTLRLLRALFSDDSAWRWRDLRSDGPYARTRLAGGAVRPDRAVAAPT